MKSTAQNNNDVVDKFRKAISDIKPRDNVILAILLFLLSYGMASLAIDSGSLIQYFLTIVGVLLAVKNLVSFMKKKLGKVSAK